MSIARLLRVAVLLAPLPCQPVLDAQGPPAAAPVVVAQVQNKTVRSTRLFVGDVRPSREVTVGSDVDGRVVEFPAEEGRRVATGALLARVRPTTTEFELAAARATLAALEAQLDERRNGPREQEIAQARARLGVADAEAAYREWALHNAEDLLRSGTASEDEVREARRQALRADGLLADAQQALELLLAGTRSEVLARGEADVAAQRARVARLDDDLARHEIRAPFAGYVVAEATEVGAWLTRGAPVVRLVELDTVEVLLPVPERDIGSVRVGAAVALEVPALPGRTFEGTVFAITPSADPRARTLPVRIRLANVIEAEQPLLMAGMFAQARLPVGVAVDALVVPPDALVLGGPTPVIHVVDRQDGGPTTARLVAVTTQTVDGDLVAVQADGLRAGDLVVVEGNERLRPGQPVQITARRD